MFLRIADGGRAHDELGRHAVERAHPFQPPNHVGNIRTEHTPVGVHLVDDDIAQILEKLRPLGVVRQYRLVQHVRVADHDIAMQANGLARITGSVAIKGKRFDAQLTRPIQFQQFGDLILCQGLGWKQVQGLGLLRHGRRDYRQCEAQ